MPFAVCRFGRWTKLFITFLFACVCFAIVITGAMCSYMLRQLPDFQPLNATTAGLVEKNKGKASAQSMRTRSHLTASLPLPLRPLHAPRARAFIHLLAASTWLLHATRARVRKDRAELLARVSPKLVMGNNQK